MTDLDDDTPSVTDEPSPPGLGAALRSLALMDDPYLSMQITNLSVVDQFCMLLEEQQLDIITSDEREIGSTIFLLAQSQMWIFAAYELLRTWRQRINKAIDLIEGGKVSDELARLRQDHGYKHSTMQMRAVQLERFTQTPDALPRLRRDKRRIHIPFTRMDALRVSLAKHEIKGQRDAVAMAPGYGRVNMWSGSIDFELSNGPVILDVISRRDIADELRAIESNPEPSDEELASFNEFMKLLKSKPPQ